MVASFYKLIMKCLISSKELAAQVMSLKKEVSSFRYCEDTGAVLVIGWALIERAT